MDPADPKTFAKEPDKIVVIVAIDVKTHFFYFN